MPNEIENTVVVPSTNDPAASATQTPATGTEASGSATTLSNTDSPESSLTPNDMEKLRVENERLRSGQSTLQKRLDRLMRQRGDAGAGSPTSQFAEEDIVNWANHPMSQEMLMKAAEVELKEGVQELLKDYPSIPDPVKKAVIANPRGWVKPGTVYVEDAVNDIEDYLMSFSTGDGAASAASKPKEFPVAGTNAGTGANVITANSGDPKTDALLELFQKGKAGLDEAFRRLTDKEVDKKTFDKAVSLAEKAGISIT